NTEQQRDQQTKRLNQAASPTECEHVLLLRLVLRPRWTTGITPTPATAVNGLRLRDCGPHHWLCRANLSATAFGGRPGPPGRHFPLRFRLRPFFAFALFTVETIPNNDWIAERTSCCTISRIKLICLVIIPPFTPRFRQLKGESGAKKRRSLFG